MLGGVGGGERGRIKVGCTPVFMYAPSDDPKLGVRYRQTPGQSHVCYNTPASWLACLHVYLELRLRANHPRMTLASRAYFL